MGDFCHRARERRLPGMPIDLDHGGTADTLGTFKTFLPKRLG